MIVAFEGPRLNLGGTTITPECIKLILINQAVLPPSLSFWARNPLLEHALAVNLLFIDIEGHYLWNFVAILRVVHGILAMAVLF